MVIGSAVSTIDLPVEDVFHFVVVDFEKNYRRWSPEVQRIEVLTDGPLRVGSRARQVRIDQGRRSDTSFRVVALEAPHRVLFVELSSKFEGEYTLIERDRRTQLRFEFRLQRLELYMRPFEKLIRMAIQEGSQRTVRNIKQLAERDATQRERGLG